MVNKTTSNSKNLAYSVCKQHYLVWISGGSTSSTIKGQEKSKSPKSSWKDNLLELLENPTRGELLEDSKLENRPESSFESRET